MSLYEERLLDLSVQDSGTEVIVSATLDPSELTPLAQKQAIALPAVERRYELYRKGRTDPAVRVVYQQRPGQKLCVRVSSADAGERGLLEKIGHRVAHMLPDWLTPDDSQAALSLVEPGLGVGQAGAEWYVCRTVLLGDRQHHRAQLLLLGRYLAFRHDPARTLRLRRSLKVELSITPDTPWHVFLEGPAGRMVLRPDYDPATCRELLPIRAPRLTAVLRWGGPEYLLQVRGDREPAVRLLHEALEAWQATLGPQSGSVEARFGYGDLKRLLGC